ncbi:amidohydrolase family protein [Mesorhizobium cantuariense]|uniref:Amidohydrolase family protein n=1 Tax=Mesorhizobium cantuariense TaxID=1300275 RepID=A0ABV7MID0_9HYPH
MDWIKEIVAETGLADTHEHLVEESRRTNESSGWLFPCDDWALLFREYIQDDLHCAGMSTVDEQRFYDPGTPSIDKFRLVHPFWERIKHTGYAQAFTHTLRNLYGIDSFSLRRIEELASRYCELKKPGYYEHVLKNVSRLTECHVNSLERIFMESEQPMLLRQDISILELSRCSAADIVKVEGETGLHIRSFEGWLAAIDHYFERYGKQAVAVKYQGAYSRRLNFEHVSERSAAEFFKSHHAERPFIGPHGEKVLQDYLFHYCVKKAGEYGLPVKLHTGYFATRDSMPLARVKNNAADLCSLLQDYPGVRFILMHIGYPYQDEIIALCKQYSNAYVDLCWAWIVNPVACVRFLTEFLVAVPSNKVLTFGGDYIMVENVVGHSVIARKGISETLSSLFLKNWVGRSEVPELAARLMNGNARDVFSRVANSEP